LNAGRAESKGNHESTKDTKNTKKTERRSAAAVATISACFARSALKTWSSSWSSCDLRDLRGSV